LVSRRAAEAKRCVATCFLEVTLLRSLSLGMALVFVSSFSQPPAVLCQTADLPVPIASPRPPYPAMARAKKISGTVLVDVEVSVEGKVVKADAVSGPEILRDMAKAAARGWRFKPRQLAFSVRLTFIFHDDSFVPPQRKPDFTSPYQVEIPLPPSHF
jgi:TonB family protein